MTNKSLNQIKVIKGYKLALGLVQCPDSDPFVLDCRSFDIPETISEMVKNLKRSRPNCIAITLSPLGGPRMIAMAERAARQCSMRILWFTKIQE